jgi:anaerobic selenocysteine-containing dehydrogenase
VLPATTFVEHDDLRRGYGTYGLQRARPAIAPVGEARPNAAVFADLCRRLDLHRPGDPETPGELAAALLDATGRGESLRAALDTEGIAYPPTGARPVQFVDVLPFTPDRRIHLMPEALDREAPDGLYAFRPDPGSARFPLALISPATERTISSTFGQLVEGPVPLGMCPADAAARGVAEGDVVRVHNELGEVSCPARLDPGLRPGVVVLPKGLWLRHTLGGGTSNALVPDDFTDLGDGACFNDARVEVERIGPADRPPGASGDR